MSPIGRAMTEDDLIEYARRWFNLSPDDYPTPSMIESVWLMTCPVKAVSEPSSRRAMSMLTNRAG
jgi:hypothetical protein